VPMQVQMDLLLVSEASGLTKVVCLVSKLVRAKEVVMMVGVAVYLAIVIHCGPIQAHGMYHHPPMMHVVAFYGSNCVETSESLVNNLQAAKGANTFWGSTCKIFQHTPSKHRRYFVRCVGVTITSKLSHSCVKYQCPCTYQHNALRPNHQWLKIWKQNSKNGEKLGV
jgi:hypothetical protein